MARPLRIQYPGAVYHVMNRGLSRQLVFRDAHDYRALLAVLAETHDLWGVEVLAYCLMPNHYHLCLRTPEGNLSRVMRHVNSVYTQRFNRSHRRDGPIFRGRYKSILIDVETYLAAVIRYVHLNPVKAKMVKAPEQYVWSSHGQYVRPQSAFPWLAVDEVIQEYGSSHMFHEFVLSGNEGEVEAFYGAGRQSPILGTDRFQAKVVKNVRAFSREHPRYERKLARPSVKQVEKVVAKEFGVPVSVLCHGRRGVPNDARKAAMYLVKRLCDLTLQDTARELGVSSYGVVGWACTQVKSKIQQDARFRRRVAQVEKSFAV